MSLPCRSNLRFAAMNTNAFNSTRQALAALVMTLLCWSCAIASSPAAIPDEELVRFVQGYLQAAEQPSPEAEVAHYANRVRYFDSGTVDRTHVAEDQRRYYKTWPQRSFELVDGPMIIGQEGEAATVQFTIRYDLRGESRRATGMTENSMQVRRFGDDLRIVAMSERKANARSTFSRKLEEPRQKKPQVRSTLPPVQVSPPPAPLPEAPNLPAKEPDPGVASERASTKSKSKVMDPEAPPTQSNSKPQSLPPSSNSASAPVTAAAPTPAPAPAKATPVPNSPGFVYPPGTEQTPRNMIDVRDYGSGQKVKDPRTGQVFIVP